MTPATQHNGAFHTSTPQGTILVVDDEPGVLLTIQAILAQEGYAVDGAPNGQAAIARLADKTYDLVLTDLRLGDMDGLDVLREIRRQSPRTVAIVLTGYASLESAIQAMREGAYDYLVKPTDVEELKLRVAHIFERHRLADELAQRVRDLEAANQTIAELNANLHSDIAQATARIRAQLDELAAAKDALEESQAQKERFIAMVAHELRAPLAPINLGAQSLRLRPDRPTTVVLYAEKIEQQVQRLDRLINDLLDVTRIDAGQFSVKLEPMDLSQMVEQKIAEYRATQPDRNFVLHVPATPIVGTFDRLRLEQALGNLLDNAVKYSLMHTSITTALAPSEGGVALSVADEGRGIPPEQLQRIFDAYVRLPDAEEIKGFGLGLYITRGIVEAHGGHLTVESGTDRALGAIFTLWLPLRDATA